MRVAALKENKTSKKMVSSFTGLDRRPNPGAGGFADMQNMSGKHSPKISVRDRRGIMNLGDDNIYSISSMDLCLNDVIYQNVLIAVLGTVVRAYYYDDSGALKNQSVLGSAVFENYNTEKESVVSGGYTYFFPDKVYVNTMDLTDAGWLEKTVNLETGAIYSETGNAYFEVVLEPCDLDGNPVDGEASYMRLMRKRYTLQDGGKGDFVGYMAYAAGFSDLDTVTISGFSLDELNGDYSIQKVDVQNTYIVLPGSKEVMQTGGITVTVARLVPDMDYVVAAGKPAMGMPVRCG